MSDEAGACDSSSSNLDLSKTDYDATFQRIFGSGVKPTKKLGTIMCSTINLCLLKEIDSLFMDGALDNLRDYLILIDSLVPPLNSNLELATLFESAFQNRSVVDKGKVPSHSKKLVNKSFRSLFLLIEFNAPKTRPLLDILLKVFTKVLFYSPIKSLKRVVCRRKFWTLVEINLRLNCDFLQQHFFKIVAIFIARLPSITLNELQSYDIIPFIMRLSKTSSFAEEVSQFCNAYQLESHLINEFPLWETFEDARKDFQDGNVNKGIENLFFVLDKCKITPRILMASNFIPLFKSVIYDAASNTFIDSNVKMFLSMSLLLYGVDVHRFVCSYVNFQNFVESIRDVIDYIIECPHDGCHLTHTCHLCPIHSEGTHTSDICNDILIEAAELLECLFVINEQWARWFDRRNHKEILEKSLFICPLTDSTLGNLLVKSSHDNSLQLFVNLAKTCPAALRLHSRVKLVKHTVLGNIWKQFYNEFKNFTVPREDFLQTLKTISSNEQAFFYPWQFQFTDELGQGVGPTKEFYALATREFQKHELGLWIGEPMIDHSGAAGNLKPQPCYTHSHNGLFPKAPEKKNREEYRIHFNLLGKVMAKMFVDSLSTVDIPLSVEFMRQAFSKANAVKLSKGYLEVADVMPSLTKMIKQLLKIKEDKEAISRICFISDDYKKTVIENMAFDEGCSFSDLCVNFMVPGTNNELKEGGEDIMLTASNLEEYLDCLGRVVVEEGPSLAIQSFREGFNEVLPIEEMTVFTPDELRLIFCGEDEEWTVEYLESCCLFTDGYNVSSPQTGFLLKLLSSFNKAERRLFLKFVCSYPTLPIGGLEYLVPCLTVTKMVSEADDDDRRLPNSSTCFNKLCLPAYSSYEITKERVLFAITEGQNSFQYI